jgi:cytochrome c-type biogenesis protein CcmH
VVWRRFSRSGSVRIAAAAWLVAALGSAILWLTALQAPPATAQEPTRTLQATLQATLRPVTQTDVNAASQNLYCPVCENLPLAVCFTDACEDWKQEVRDLLAQGYTIQQIEAYFIERFGQKTVGTPSTPQATFLTIVLPAALIGLIGVVIGVNLLRWRSQQRMTHAAEVDDDPSDPDADAYRARVEAALKARDE